MDDSLSLFASNLWNGLRTPLFASGGLLDLRSSSSSHMRRSPLLHLQDPVRPCFCHKEHTQPHFSYFLYGCRSNLATFQCFYSQGLSIKRSLPFGSHWSDAMHTFQEKFNSLSSLIVDHDIDSTPQEEFLSLLGGARTKRVSKVLVVREKNFGVLSWTISSASSSFIYLL
ncbi:hypothetical protein K1719_043355 [Acacia pycnantha]|nr:hypothetical protein K1719_043355 [Acacia pycnantha]